MPQTMQDIWRRDGETISPSEAVYKSIREQPPGVEGFYFASGCNVAGLSISPTIGETLATWIVDGKPPVDLSPMSCMRFKDKSRSEAHLRRDAAWQYRHFYGAV
jgi:hypothetical protein